MRLNRFSGFAPLAKPLKRLKATCPSITRLKPGANKKRNGFNKGLKAYPPLPARRGDATVFKVLIVIPVGLPVALPALFYGYAMFDRLVKAEYDSCFPYSDGLPVEMNLGVTKSAAWKAAAWNPKQNLDLFGPMGFTLLLEFSESL